MKKFLSSLILCMIMVCASAQTHMKFMGIPLDGHINTFSSKLKAKGATISPLNKQASVGLRLFNGKFYDHLCTFWVSYNAKTGVVYNVRVVIENSMESVLEKTKENIEDVIKEKYLYNSDFGKTNGGTELNVYHIFKDEDSPAYGLIYLGISKDDNYPYNYLLSITYEDVSNASKNQKNIEDDI